MKTNLILGLALLLVAGFLIGYAVKSPAPAQEATRENWMAMADEIRGKLAREGRYDCCLIKPCWYCIQKTPGHGEGADCACRQDILNGEHPCGECIGEILEGHGLPELKPYYAPAIAHKVGEQHLAHLESIINDMYQ